MRSALAAPSLVCVAAAIAVAGCQNNMLAYVDGALLPDADGVVAAEDGPTVVVKPDTDLAALAIPKAPVIRLAIDRDVPWLRVDELLGRVTASGARPVLLVGQRTRVHGFQLREPLPPGDAVQVRVDADGQHCVSKTGVLEMRCTKGAGRHVHRTFVREDVREAVKEYDLRGAEIRVDPTVGWADVVRAVDGARTCCFDTRIAATLAP